MHPERRVRLSRFLSLVLRHRPETVGLALDPEGRVSLEALAAALRTQTGWEGLTADDVAEVVRRDARRFEVRDGLIRARYGHTVALARPGPPARPPEWLYVAVPEDALAAVQAEGLRPGPRQHVHLCTTPGEARRPLERHGVPGRLVTILGRRAHDAGVPFYRVADHLYLTDRIPPTFLLLAAAPVRVD